MVGVFCFFISKKQMVAPTTAKTGPNIKPTNKGNSIKKE